MISSLFSVFDPSCGVSFLWPVKWISCFGFLFLSSYSFWVTGGVGESMTRMWGFVKMSKPYFGASYKMFFAVLLVVCLQIFFINVLGLVPYSFTPSSHFSFNISLALVGWTGGVLFMIKRSWEGFLSHLVPHGSPMILAPLMVMIESVSTVIRPISLSVRLMANIMGGHVVMVLVGDSVLQLGVGGFPVTFGVSMGLMVFEVCVAMIQAYVFWNLMTLYWEEGTYS